MLRTSAPLIGALGFTRKRSGFPSSGYRSLLADAKLGSYSHPMPDHYFEIESFKFADIVKQWARERLVHDVIVGRELARGITREGLRFNSVDPKWTKPGTEL